MTFANLIIVSRYQMKLLFRNWIVWFLFLIVLGLILFYQIDNQRIFGETRNDFYSMLSSLIPATNAYFFNLLQVLPFLYLAGDYIYGNRKLDTLAVIDSRPQGNASCTGGMSLGIVIVFLFFGAISLFLGILVNLFASKLAFNGWYSLFYLFTYVLPTTIFLTGFSFFVVYLTRNRLFSFILLIGYLLLTVVLLPDTCQGLFDPFALHVPNIFSDMVGFPDPWGYFLHRFCWLLCGIGFFSAAVVLSRRLPNSTRDERLWKFICVICFVLGAGNGTTFYLRYQGSVEARRLYRDVYVQYNSYPKVTLLDLDMDYESRGSRLSVDCRLRVRNQNKERVENLLLYLNPSLELESARVDGKDIPWKRDEQVLLLYSGLAAGEVCEVEIRYRGKIDERICYVDIPDKTFFDLSDRGDFTCRFGKRFAYLGEDYTLLTPECLWYPVCTPPVNPGNVYAVDKHFFNSTLKIRGTGDKAVFSQGASFKEREVTLFRSTKPLVGLSLVVGRYTGDMLPVDSVQYGYYVYPGHGDYFNGLEVVSDSLPGVISSFSKAGHGKPYPFDRYLFVETPLSFCSFYRVSRNGSGYVQPEMYFFPEQMIGIPLPNFKEEIVRMEEEDRVNRRGVLTPFRYEMRVLERTIRQVMFYTKIVKGQPINVLNKFDENKILVNNLYVDFPLYNDYTISFNSKEYPVLNTLLNQMTDKANFEEYLRTVYPQASSGIIDNSHVRYYLSKNSFSDALLDASFLPVLLNDLLRIKVDQLKDILLLYSSSEELNKFLVGFVQQYTFKQVDFETFNTAYKQEFGIDWMEFLPQWYSENRVPAYIIRDFKMAEILESGMTENLTGKKRYKVQASIYNTGEVDGIISFSFYTDKGPQQKNFLVKRHEGQRIEWIGEEIGFGVILLTNIARNNPGTKYAQKGVTTNDTTQRIEQLPFSYFQPPANEIIVNEDDEGFRIIQPKSRLLLGRLLGQREEGYITINGSSPYTGELPEWTYFAAPSYAYGDITEGFVSKKAGRGDFSVEWHARIEKSGMYEIFVYMTPIPCLTCKRYIYNLRNSIPTNTIQLFQYYTVTCDEGVKEIPLDVNIGWKAEKGKWISLGRFKLTPGEHVITLSDKSNTSDFNIYADAVKWVYIEDE